MKKKNVGFVGRPQGVKCTNKAPSMADKFMNTILQRPFS